MSCLEEGDFGGGGAWEGEREREEERGVQVFWFFGWEVLTGNVVGWLA